MPTLLKCSLLQYLQHFLHTRGVVVPVESEASSSALAHLNHGDSLLGVGAPNTAGVLQNGPDHCLVHTH